MNVKDWNGKKITEPGIYRGIPLDAYHGDICDGPSVSSSGLRTIFNQSPKHYWAKSALNTSLTTEELAERNKASQALILGRAAHHLFLEQKQFAKTFVVRSDTAPDGRNWNGNNKSCQAWTEAQLAAGKTVLTPDQWSLIQGMARALHAEPMIQTGILNGKVEHSMFSIDAETGVWLKIRPDVIPTDAFDYVDLKLTNAIDDEDLQWTVGEYGYHMQGALIGEVSEAVLGQPMTTFNLIFLENEVPHCIRAVELKADALLDGRKNNRAALRLFARCWERQDWIGPSGHQTEMAPLGLHTRRAERNEYRRSLIARELAS